MSSPAYASNSSVGDHATAFDAALVVILCAHSPVATSAMSMNRSSDALARYVPSAENDSVRTGHYNRGTVRTHALSLASKMDTSASALPTAKCAPVGSNAMQ